MKTLIVVGLLILTFVAVQTIPEYPLFVLVDGYLYLTWWGIAIPSGVLVFVVILGVLATLYVIGSRMERTETASRVRAMRGEIDASLDRAMHGEPLQPAVPTEAGDLGGAVCDVCSRPTAAAEGFVLTTTEVASSPAYWKQQLVKYRPVLRELESDEERARYLAQRSRELADSPTGWLVCPACTHLFDFDRAAAKAASATGIDREDSGPASFEDIQHALAPAIIEIAQSAPAAEPAPSSSRFWQCPRCGSIHFKNADTMELVAALGTIPSGGTTCSDCGTRSDAADIYSGALDLDAPDDLIDRMLADPERVSSDPDTRVWRYQGQEIRGPASRS